MHCFIQKARFYSLYTCINIYVYNSCPFSDGFHTTKNNMEHNLFSPTSGAKIKLNKKKKNIYSHSAKIFLAGHLTFCVVWTHAFRTQSTSIHQQICQQSLLIAEQYSIIVAMQLTAASIDVISIKRIHKQTQQHELKFTCPRFNTHSLPHVCLSMRVVRFFSFCRRLSSQRLSGVARCWAVVVIVWRNCAICRLWLLRALQKTNCLHPRPVIH